MLPKVLSSLGSKAHGLAQRPEAHLDPLRARRRQLREVALQPGRLLRQLRRQLGRSGMHRGCLLCRRLGLNPGIELVNLQLWH